jgi:hypothetical protein
LLDNKEKWGEGRIEYYAADGGGMRGQREHFVYLIFSLCDFTIFDFIFGTQLLHKLRSISK